MFCITASHHNLLLFEV